MSLKERTADLKAAYKKLDDLMLAADPSDWHYHAFESDEAWTEALDEAKAEVYALEAATSALDPS